jgi:hypothetical protein
MELKEKYKKFEEWGAKKGEKTPPEQRRKVL